MRTFTSCKQRISAQLTSQDHLAHYVIVRKDLPHGAAAAQIVHAAGESSPGNLPEGTFAIVLEAESAEHLESISKALALHGLEHVRVVETDEPWSGQLMVLGLVPCARSRVRGLLRYLPSYGRSKGR